MMLLKEKFTDDINVKDYDLEYLHSLIGYVPKAVLFSGTIESNLKLGKEDATQEELELLQEFHKVSNSF